MKNAKNRLDLRGQEMKDYLRRKARQGKARFRYVHSLGILTIGVSHEDGEWSVWRCPDAELVAGGCEEPE